MSLWFLVVLCSDVRLSRSEIMEKACSAKLRWKYSKTTQDCLKGSPSTTCSELRTAMELACFFVAAQYCKELSRVLYTRSSARVILSLNECFLVLYFLLYTCAFSFSSQLTGRRDENRFKWRSSM